MYRPIKASFKPQQTRGTTFMSKEGLNKRDLPQLLDVKFAMECKNYMIDTEGQLKKRRGLEELFDLTGTDGFTMLEQYDSDTLIYGYGTTVGRYVISTGTATSIKTNFTANDKFEGARYGDYFFVTNGVDKVWRMKSDFTIAEVAGSTAGADNVKAIGNRLYVSVADSVLYSAIDDGTDPPFDTWTVGTLATDGGEISYRNGGTVTSIESLGPSIVVFAEDGKWSFFIDQIDSAGTLSKVDVTQMYRQDFGGERGSISTSDGLFYVNEAGLWQLVGVGQTDIPFSDQEALTSVLLGKDYFEDINFDNADIIYDDTQRYLFITCAKDSDTNNHIIAYNLDLKAFSEFTGWNLARFVRVGDTIYGASTINNKVYKLFQNYDDDGLNIGTVYRQELQMGALYTRQIILGCYIQGFLSPSTDVEVRFDIYDVTGRKIEDKKKFRWELDYNDNGNDGWDGGGWDESGWDGDQDMAGMVESFGGCRPFIRNWQRIQIHITSGDQLNHIINWISLEARVKASIRRRNLTDITS